MPDLHGWITAKVEAVEAIAHGASVWGAEWYQDDLAEEIRDLWGGNTLACVFFDAIARQIIANDPAYVLRRCEADRRILARHSVDPVSAVDPLWATACTGCGCRDCDDPVTENINDCPELLDLAHAHGITDGELAGLDRPQPPPRPPVRPDRVWPLMPLMRTADVPAALRGPNWRRHP